MQASQQCCQLSVFEAHASVDRTMLSTPLRIPLEGGMRLQQQTDINVERLLNDLTVSWVNPVPVPGAERFTRVAKKRYSDIEFTAYCFQDQADYHAFEDRATTWAQASV